MITLCVMQTKTLSRVKKQLILMTLGNARTVLGKPECLVSLGLLVPRNTLKRIGSV